MNLVIATPRVEALTETFIKAHIENLAGKINIISGHYPHYFVNNQSLSQFYPKPSFFLQKIESILPFCVTFRLRLQREYRIKPAEIIAKILKEHADVVLAEYGPTGSDLAPICAQSGVPLVVHFHGYDASKTEIINKFRNSYLKMFDFSSFIVVVSIEMKEKLMALGAPEDKIVLNPCGPNPGFFGVKPSYKSNNILALGRLTEKKAPHLTILSFSIALKECPNLRLVMVGDGHLKGACVSLVFALGIEDKVTFSGEKNFTEIITQMEQSFLFVQHSIVSFDGDSEGVPVGIIEAGAAGLPVVGTRHAGIPDVVVNNETGFLVDEGDVKQMANKIVFLEKNRDEVRRIGENAKKRIAKFFSLKRHIETLDDCLRKSVENFK